MLQKCVSLSLLLSIVDGCSQSAKAKTDAKDNWTVPQTVQTDNKITPEIKEINFEQDDSYTLPHPHKANEEAYCGIVPDQNTTNQDRIVNGNLTNPPHKYPWMVYMYVSGSLCGGSIITEFDVLTAAHCFFNSKGRIDPETKNTYAVVNVINKWKDRWIRDRRYYCEEIKFPPGLNKSTPTTRTRTVDAAICRTKHSIKFGPHVTSICLPDKKYQILRRIGFFPFDNQDAYIAGYGQIKSEGPNSKDLLEAKIKTWTQAKCKTSSGWGNRITNYHMCAAPSNTGACNGDSGGPLMVTDKYTSNLVIVGIMSFGVKECPDKTTIPLVYVRVTEIQNWIEETVKGRLLPSKFPPGGREDMERDIEEKKKSHQANNSKVDWP